VGGIDAGRIEGVVGFGSGVDSVFGHANGWLGGISCLGGGTATAGGNTTGGISRCAGAGDVS
jgi:hypothetical protein